jgi:pimeloyl-ACP methyl ester carboxylesterase
MRVILLAGWNEAAARMQTFADGRHGLDGLAAFGYDCTPFPADGDDPLRPRIDRFAAFLDQLRAREGDDIFPLATIGYSMGGLVNRGFLRAYPERAHEIAASIQIAAPNAGLITNYASHTLRIAHVPSQVLADLDVASPFLTWLNATTGHWIPDPDNPRKQRWKLDGPPWVAPAGHRLLSIAGRMPKYELQSDGVVMIESASLGGALPCTTIDDDGANHLNLGATSNPFATIFRRFRHDDSVWPRCVALIAMFLRGEPLDSASAAARTTTSSPAAEGEDGAG